MKIIFPVLYYADPFEAPDCLAAFTTEEAANTFAKKFVAMRKGICKWNDDEDRIVVDAIILDPADLKEAKLV